MAKYKAYPEYKDSGVEWLGEVPSHWEILSAKRMFQSVRTPAYKSDEQLAASQKYGVIPQSLMMQLNDSKVMLALKGTESFRHVEANNFVISLRSFEGGIEYSQYTGCVSPAYTVLKKSKSISYGYYRYLLKCMPFIAALQSSTDSLRDGKSINYEQFSALSLPLFSVQEQNVIAVFLDHETAKIDNLIEKQQQLIELLKEKRQAVISHAVTKGLNPDVPMKDSGVEWLGDVPEHWIGSYIKNLCYVNDGNHGEEYPNDKDFVAPEEGVPFIRAGDFDKFRVVDRDLRFISHKKNNSMRKGRLQKNDILFVNRGATIGKLCIIDEKYVGANLNSQVAYLRADTDKVNYRYLTYFISSKYIQTKISSSIQGGALPQYPLKNILNLDVWHGSLDEQETIADFIDAIVRASDSLIDKSIAAIELMQERRTALIAAAVTGKIDVRDWVAPDAQDIEASQEATA